MVTKVSAGVMEKIGRHTPKGGWKFGPNVSGSYQGYDMEWAGKGWYFLCREVGTEYYFWRRLDVEVRAGESEQQAASATARSYGATSPTYLERKP